MFASVIDYPTISRSEQATGSEFGTDQELNIIRHMNKIFVKFDKVKYKNDTLKYLC